MAGVWWCSTRIAGRGADAVRVARQVAGGRGMPNAEPARLQRKWVRKQIGLTIVAAGAMIVFLHGMVQLMV